MKKKALYERRLATTNKRFILFFSIQLMWMTLPPSDSFSQSYTYNDSMQVNPKIYLSVGGYFPNMITSLRIDSRRGIGTEIGLEDDFKLKNKLSVFRTDATIRVSNRSQFALSYTKMNRDRSFELEKDISFGDTTFYAGSLAKMNFDVNYYALTYRYSFFDRPNWNAGLSTGIRFIKFKANLDASFNDRSYARSSNTLVPALLLGAHGAGYMTPRFLVRYALEYFQLSVSGIDLNIIETQLSLQYFITERFSLGGGYATSYYKVRDIPLDNFKGRILFSFEGFNLFAGFRI